MRIDLVLLSGSLAATVRSANVDREERKRGASGEVPSDHAPVVVDLDLDADHRGGVEVEVSAPPPV
jgi:exodeoxyribonuclease-3